MDILYDPDFNGLNSFNQIIKKPFKDKLIDFQRIIGTLYEMGEAMHTAKIEIPMNKRNLEMMIYRFALITSSIHQLLQNGSPLFSSKEETKWFHDLSGIYTLLRSQIENYLMIEYLVFQKMSAEERQFRSDLYELSGMCNRQKFSASTTETKEKKELEKSQIEAFREKINKSHYLKENPGLKKMVNKAFPKATIYNSKKDLIEKSELNTRLFYNEWSLTSNHAHAEYLSAIQSRDFLLDESNSMQTLNTCVMVTMGLTSVFVVNLKYEYVCNTIVYNGQTNDLREIISSWKSIATQAS